MKYEDEIMIKLLNIETTIEEIFKEITKIRKENDNRILEQTHIIIRLENMADFIKDKYNIET